MIVATGLAGGTTASAGTNPGQADGPGIITLEQLNMCMWGSDRTGDCFVNHSTAEPEPGNPVWDAAERDQAALKRQSVLTQISRHNPDVITVNEGCANDLASVAAEAGYQLRTVDTGHNCTVERGRSVNAILAKNITDGGDGHSFPYPDGVDVRAYLCAQVSTDEWSSVRVCTAHLATKKQGEPEGSQRRWECDYLRDHVLDPAGGYVLFAGDVNTSTAGDNCAPSRFHGLRDREWHQTTPDDPESPAYRDGLQHLYYSANGFWRQSCGWAYTVEHTDHYGFLLELGKSAPSGEDVSDCGVREIR